MGNDAIKLRIGCPSDSRPNFLIVMVDDINPDHFGCYGNTMLKPRILML